jgi:hypothetical protein
MNSFDMQCCESVTFCHRDPDPDPALFISGFQDANQKIVFFPIMALIEGSRYRTVHLHQSSTIKSHNEVTKQ